MYHFYEKGPERMQNIQQLFCLGQRRTAFGCCWAVSTYCQVNRPGLLICYALLGVRLGITWTIRVMRITGVATELLMVSLFSWRTCTIRPGDGGLACSDGYLPYGYEKSVMWLSCWNGREITHGYGLVSQIRINLVLMGSNKMLSCEHGLTCE